MLHSYLQGKNIRRLISSSLFRAVIHMLHSYLQGKNVSTLFCVAFERLTLVVNLFVVVLSCMSKHSAD